MKCFINLIANRLTEEIVMFDSGYSVMGCKDRLSSHVVVVSAIEERCLHVKVCRVSNC